MKPYTWEELFEISKYPPDVRALYAEHGFIAIVALKLAQAMRGFVVNTYVCDDSGYKADDRTKCALCSIRGSCAPPEYKALVVEYTNLYEAQR